MAYVVSYLHPMYVIFFYRLQRAHCRRLRPSVYHIFSTAISSVLSTIRNANIAFTHCWYMAQL